MTSRDFAYWLQGYLEIASQADGKHRPLDADQVACVARHLALVFQHEIDPLAGGKTAQEALNKTHGPPPSSGWPGREPVMRC